ELGSIGFLDEYDSRPNRLFLEYVQQTREVRRTIWAQYPLLLIATGLAVAAAAWFAWRTSSRLLREHQPWSTRRRLLVLPVMAALIVVGARSTLGARYAGRSFAVFSNSHLANELAPNSLYTLANAFLDMRLERSPDEMYGKMERGEMIER